MKKSLVLFVIMLGGLSVQVRAENELPPGLVLPPGLRPPRTMDDEVTLAKNAQDDKNREIRREEVAKLTDQTLLAEIAKNPDDLEIGKIAVANLKDQMILADVAKHSKDMWVSEAAVRRVNDQALLADIVKNGNHSWVRDRAALGLNVGEHKVLFAEIAETDESLQVRLTAMMKLNDPVILAEFSANLLGHWRRHREVADNTAHDQTALAVSAKTDKDKCVRISAVKRLADQTVLAEVVKNDKDWLVRLFAIGKLETQATLAELAENEKDVLVRNAATERLKDLRGEDPQRKKSFYW